MDATLLVHKSPENHEKGHDFSQSPLFMAIRKLAKLTTSSARRLSPRLSCLSDHLTAHLQV